MANEPPEAISDRAVRPIAPTSGNDLSATAAQILACDREEPAIAQLIRDQKSRHMSPAHTLKNDFLLHHLIADCAGTCAFNEIVVASRAVPRGVANNALRIVAHVFGRDLIRNGKRQEVRRDDRKKSTSEESDEFQPYVALLDVMKNQIHLFIEKPFPWPRDRLEE